MDWRPVYSNKTGLPIPNISQFNRLLYPTPTAATGLTLIGQCQFRTHGRNGRGVIVGIKNG